MDLTSHVVSYRVSILSAVSSYASSNCTVKCCLHMRADPLVPTPMAEGEETEVLLALLSSMFNGPIPSQEQLLCALIDAGGDVTSAATNLNSNKAGKSSGKNKPLKRKRGDKLDAWIVSKKKPKDTNNDSHPRSQATGSSHTLNITYGSNGTPEEPIEIASEDEDDKAPLEMSVANQPTASSPKGKNFPPIPLISVLKQAPSPTKAPLRIPPRMLGTPALVAQRTPCTLHYSILPPELACRLFYAMLREASHWSRNKWYVTLSARHRRT